MFAYTILVPIILLASCLLPLSTGRIVYNYNEQEPSAAQYAHPSVVENAQKEAELPPELLKSHRFLSDPRTAAALAKDSWFTEQEMPVYEREADKIPRGMIQKLLKESGLDSY